METSTEPSAIGKFQIERLLGKGEKASVYLALDSDLKRKVAIKSFHDLKLKQNTSYEQMFSEAESISHFQHPNIVSIYELGIDNSKPYIVLEYIDGDSLKERIKKNILLTDAIKVMQGIMNGVAAAHELNITHCDLKPANILLDQDGNARVVDFGLSQFSTPRNQQQTLYGTPQYMAPEYIETEAHNPVSDVFSLGLIFYELLTGKPLFEGDDSHQILNLISNTNIPAPSTINPEIDQNLDAFILKSLDRDSQSRFNNAGEMLAVFNEMQGLKNEPTQISNNESTDISQLIRKIKLRNDFPSFTQTIETLKKVTSDDNITLSTLSNTILRDVSLTNKLLKIVNSAYFNRSDTKISSISRAVILLGLNELRHIATSIMLFDNIQDSDHSEQLQELVFHALMSAQIGHEIAKINKLADKEDAYVCSLLNSLGKLLVKFYLQEESKNIDLLVIQQNIPETKATHKVLGVNYYQLGMGIAREWNFPDNVIKSMKPIESDAYLKIYNDTKALQFIAHFSNELVASLRLPFIQQPKKIISLVDRFSQPLKINKEITSSLLQNSCSAMIEFSKIVKFDFLKSIYSRPHELYDKSVSQATRSKSDGDIGILKEKLELENLTSIKILNEGIHEIINALTQDISINEVVQLVLESIYRAMPEYRVLIAFHNPKNKVIQAKMGFGDNINELKNNFSFVNSSVSDVFGLSLNKNVDILIKDTKDKKIKNNIPTWYSRKINAKSFVIFPIVIKKRPIGIIYIDGDLSGTVDISNEQLGALKTLRNQLIMGINSQ